MKEIDSILERAKLENIISYLMYDSESTTQRTEEHESRIRKSYDYFFARIQKLFPDIDTNDDNLFFAAVELAGTHEEVFLELGISIGFQLYKNQELIYQDMTSTEVKTMVQAEKEKSL